MGQLARQSDARDRLQKIRNLKEGKLEVKAIGKGGITMTKKTDGKIHLTTRKNKVSSKQQRNLPEVVESAEVRKVGNFTKTVLGSGKVSLSTSRPRGDLGMRSKSDSSRGSRENQATKQNRGRVSDQERLDEELMSSTVSREEILRMKEFQPKSLSKSRPGRSRSPLNPRSRSPLRQRAQMRSRSSPQRSRSPLRSRSPQRATYIGRSEDPRRRQESPVRRGGGRFDYDEPRSARDEDDMLRRRSKGQEFDDSITLGGRLEHGATVSPLQGTKVTITNLQDCVTQDDIVELFGDIGALRRAKLLNPGHAEVTFVNHSHAVKAVEVYNNRHLDGKPMKCRLMGVGSAPASGGSSIKLPPSLSGKAKSSDLGPPPDVESIHRALFFNKKMSGKKPTFTITMPKKGKGEPEFY